MSQLWEGVGYANEKFVNLFSKFVRSGLELKDGGLVCLRFKIC